MNPDWRLDAACRDTGPAEFFSDRLDPPPICSTCPVRLDCLQFALDTHQDHGWWGGVSEADRFKMAGRVRRRVPPDVGLGSVACGYEKGTPAGYQRHRRSHEAACDLCRVAHTDQTRVYKDRKRRSA